MYRSAEEAYAVSSRSAMGKVYMPAFEVAPSAIVILCPQLQAGKPGYLDLQAKSTFMAEWDFDIRQNPFEPWRSMRYIDSLWHKLDVLA